MLEIHLEHTANEVRGDGRGGLEPTGEPEVRWWFTTQEPGLEAAVQAALEAEDLRRSLVVPPDVFGPIPDDRRRLLPPRRACRWSTS